MPHKHSPNTETLGRSAQGHEARAGASLSSLEADSSCCRGLNWRCDLSPPLAAEPLESNLAEEGYVSRCRHPALRVLRHAAGHEIAWVLTTGRIQIRIPTSVEKPERRREAEAIHALLLARLVEQEHSPFLNLGMPQEAGVKP